MLPLLLVGCVALQTAGTAAFLVVSVLDAVWALGRGNPPGADVLVQVAVGILLLVFWSWLLRLAVAWWLRRYPPPGSPVVPPPDAS